VQRVHANRVAAGLHARATCRLQYAKLCLKLGYVTLEGIERTSNLIGVISVIGERNVLDPREGRQRRRLCSSWILRRHGSLSSLTRDYKTEIRLGMKYACSIG